MNLQDIFEQQIKLNTKIKPDLYEKIKFPAFRRKWFLKYVLALREEISEAVNSINWKFWAKDKVKDDWDNVKLELIDVLHFWVSLATIAGLTADDVFELYAKKNKLNHHRQERGYKEGNYDKIKDGKEDNEELFL